MLMIASHSRNFSHIFLSSRKAFYHFSTTSKMAANAEMPSLKIGAETLRNAAQLSVPAITSESVLKLEQQQYAGKGVDRQPSPNWCSAWQCGAPIPGAVGPLVRTRVLRNARVSKMGSGCIHKAKWELELLLDNRNDEDSEGVQRALLVNCDAGDSFNVLFDNPSEEVNFVLQRLGISSEQAVAAHAFTLNCSPPECNRKFAHLPPHCSPRQLLAQFVDIRRAPARLTLRALSDHAREPTERRRLLELASAQGSAEFTRFVRKPNISLAELLCEFPSLSPSLECLVEFLPRLLPRHYTLACYLPASTADENAPPRFRFVYSVLELPSPILQECPQFAGIQRHGACSQWLLQLRPGDVVQLVQKEASKFRLLPPSLVPPGASSSPIVQQQQHDHLLLNTPLLMIGPGTGVAPFIAFLQKIRHCIERNGGVEANKNNVERILIYASSNLEDEYLFKCELERSLADGVLSALVACESRPTAAASVGDAAQGVTARPARIYDALRARAAEVADILTDDDGDSGGGGLLFACGDVKNMSRELWQCLSQILQSQKGFTPTEAIERLKHLRDKEILIEDVWS